MDRPFTITYEYEKDIACPNCTTPTLQTQRSIKTFWAKDADQAKDKFHSIQYDVNVKIIEVHDDFAMAHATALKEKQKEEMAKRTK
jgi:hypothetical protein